MFSEFSKCVNEAEFVNILFSLSLFNPLPHARIRGGGGGGSGPPTLKNYKKYRVS